MQVVRVPQVVIIPVVALWLPMVQTVRLTIEIHQLHVNKVVDFPVVLVVRVPQVVYIPVVTQRLIPMVFLTMDIPQLQFIDKVIDFPVCCLGDAWCW